jgi:DNA polymerase-1
MNSSSEEWLTIWHHIQKSNATLLPPQTILNYIKPQAKQRRSVDLLVVLLRTTKQQLPISSIQYFRKHNTFLPKYSRWFRIKLLLQNLLKQQSVCFDTETTGLDALHAELVGISFSYERKSFYVPFLKIRRTQNSQFIYSVFWKWGYRKIGQNLKYDLKYYLIQLEC